MKWNKIKINICRCIKKAFKSKNKFGLIGLIKTNFMKLKKKKKKDREYWSEPETVFSSSAGKWPRNRRLNPTQSRKSPLVFLSLSLEREKESSRERRV